MRYVTPSALFAVGTLAAVFFFWMRYISAAQNSPVELQWVRGEDDAPLAFAGRCHPMEKSDRLPVLLITVIYALTAFFQLGDLTAPQETYDFSAGSTALIRVEGEAVYTTGFRYYSGLGTGSYNIEISADGEHWSTLWQRKDDPEDTSKVTGYFFADAEGYPPNYALTQKYNQLYKWIDVTVENPQYVRYLRITGKADKEVLELSRLCLLGQDGQPVRFNWTGTEAERFPQLFLVDETVPDRSTWHNSTYFDEIYHARTAKEHIDGVYPYEVTHPPLGKLLMGIGIRLFGMAPFGWRFTGTLFGVLMLPILYVFLKNMFGKTAVAACGTILFATEFMHLTQTRIATIDTYGVFFILLMYFFMYRYLTLPAGTSFAKGTLPLFLSGLFWGLGAASKWTVFYAGIGLALLYFMGFYQKLRDWPEDGEVSAGPWAARTLLFSVLCFVLIPFAIYTAAYIPYAQAREVELFAHSDTNGLALLFQNVWGKLTFAGEGKFEGAYIPQDNLLNIMANNQWYMFNYHSGVTQAHPYASRWFHWLVNGRPILYYMDNVYEGAVLTQTTRFAAFANPVTCWAGLGAILTCMARSFRRTWAKVAALLVLGGAGVLALLKVDHFLAEKASFTNHLLLLGIGVALYLLLTALALLGANGHDGRAAFLSVGYLSQLLPWLLIGRTTFEYHYFPSLLFLTMALAYLFNGLMEWDRGWRKPVYGLTGLSVGLYALFYPVLIGLTIPGWYQPLVKWLESWPF